jgi:hypothetical protein
MAIFVFLTLLASGFLVSLAVVRLGAEGRKFFLFNGAVALALGGIALGARLLGPGRPGVLPGLPAALLGAAALALVASYLVLASLGRDPRLVLRAGAALSALAVMADALALHAGRARLPAGLLLHVLNASTSAWLAGSILLAMILGHFYLVIPRLSIEPLRALFRFSLAGLAARLLLVAVAGAIWWSTLEGAPLGMAVFLHDGVFVLQRLLFGLLIPASLATFTWKTIEMRSTQSATGILYVVVFLTLVGEALSVYLSLETQVPI